MGNSSRAVLITGSEGWLGRSLTEEFSANGYLVFGTDLVEKSSADAYESGDLGDDDFLDYLIESFSDFLRTVGRPEFGVIHNAGYVGTSEIPDWAVDFSHQGLDPFRSAVNLAAVVPFRLAQRLSMNHQHGFRWITTISSIYSIVGPQFDMYAGTAMQNPAGYAAAKGAMLATTRWLASYLGPVTRANSVSPGGILRGQPEPFIEKYIDRTPLKRMATEADVVSACFFLASDGAAYITGQNLVVDGGFTAI